MSTISQRVHEMVETEMDAEIEDQLIKLEATDKFIWVADLGFEGQYGLVFHGSNTAIALAYLEPSPYAGDLEIGEGWYTELDKLA